jgi:signal transduction histidine kinase
LHASDNRLPRVYLDRLIADGRPLDLTHAQISSAARKLEFQFTVPTYLAPERVRFRYRLEGFDSDWVDGDTRRFATYPAPPPGRHVFSVNASYGDLAWSPQIATVAFEVLPLWWETWWARAGMVSAAVVALAMLVRYWSHRRLKADLARLEQNQRLEAERNRIARDLHDDLGASLTQASMMAEELSEDWNDISDPKEQSSLLAQRVRTIARDLDAVVWTVSPKNDLLSSLSAYLTHFAEEYFRRSAIECRAQLAENIPPLPLSPEVRHHLFMIAKELLNNVLKHSKATHVEVTIRMGASGFELIVADNGRGFSLAAAETSDRNGLRNLRSRAAEAGGSLEIASSPRGTTATLHFPVPAAVHSTGPNGHHRINGTNGVAHR